jgi:tRNA (guanosine-2'-O-)-methyltransferase
MPSLSEISNKELIEHLSVFVLEKRLELLQKVLSSRTRYMTVVLENIFQSQNASAVLRSCECFGIQDVHVIENNNQFNVNPRVVMGASKWLNIKKYNNTPNNSIEAINRLKEKGYRIVATSPHKYNVSLNDFDINKGKFALFFGTELTGLSSSVIENADEFMLIPTFGFSESLNISVSAAICIHTLANRLANSYVDYKLSPEESDELLLHWLRLSVKSWKSIEKRYLNQKKNK